jgi:hypothetical protein
MFARGIPFVLLLVSSSAMALDTAELGQFGSLSLDEMMPLIDKSLQLKHAVGDAVAKAKMKADEIGCVGRRFPGQWHNLAGERTAPYVCKIGDKWLEVRATVEVLREDHAGSDEKRDDCYRDKPDVEMVGSRPASANRLNGPRGSPDVTPDLTAPHERHLGLANPSSAIRRGRIRGRGAPA